MLCFEISVKILSLWIVFRPHWVEILRTPLLLLQGCFLAQRKWRDPRKVRENYLVKIGAIVLFKFVSSLSLFFSSLPNKNIYLNHIPLFLREKKTSPEFVGIATSKKGPYSGFHVSCALLILGKLSLDPLEWNYHVKNWLFLSTLF